MGHLKFETSFERGGKTLAEWLPLLVDDRYEQRLAAASALGGMWQALPAYGTKFDELDTSLGMPDLAAQAERFQEEIRAAVDAPEFPAAIFVRKLLLFRMSLHEDWLKRVRKMSHHDEKYDRLETQTLEASLSGDDEAAREKAAQRFRRLFCASLERDNRITATAESMQAPGMVSYLVMQSLDGALLMASDVLIEMLEDRGKRHEAVEAIARIGPAGRALAPRLLRDLEAASDDWFDASRALASVGRGDPETVDRVLALARSESSPQSAGAMSVLADMGPDLAGRESACIDLLLEMSKGKDEERQWQSLPALASVGRNDERALAVVLDVAKSRPPDMRTAPSLPGYQYDHAMNRRGPAIEGLAHFTRFPDQTIPTLADAIETFEEYDPDWCYNLGEHGRVIASLRAFGAAAAPAAAVLAGKVREKDATVDWEVIRFLGELGPSASAALPALRQLRAEIDEKAGQEEPDAPLVMAIRRIEG